MPNPARRRFAAALALYLAWVIALAAMAVTSSERPPGRPPASGPAEDASPSRPATP